jgi:hypothetical protein
MSATNTLENDLLLLLFNNTNISNSGDATGIRGSSTAGSWFVSLHTSDPGEAGSTAAEAAYTNYARVAVARSGAGWTVSGTAPTQVANAAVVTFPTCGATGGGPYTHFGVHDAITAGTMKFKGALGANYTAALGNTPQFNAGALVVSAD